MNQSLLDFERDFPWESEDQKKGFLSLVQFVRQHIDRPLPLQIPGYILATYFIQKDHESTEWFLEYIARVTEPLEKRILLLEQQLAFRNEREKNA